MNSKAKEQSKIAADSMVFLANGGTIEQLPYDPSAENAAMVGHWEYMGDPVHDQKERRKYGEDLIDTIHDDDLRLYEQERDYAIESAMADAHEYFSVDERQDWEGF